MISMSYDLSKLPISNLLRPISDACIALARLDERDASHDIRTPTYELTIAHDVLKTRRRIAAQLPGWALSADGLRSLRGQGRIAADCEASETLPVEGTVEADGRPLPTDEAEDGGGEEADVSDPLAAELAAIDVEVTGSSGGS